MRIAHGSLTLLLLAAASIARADGPIVAAPMGPLPAGTWFRDHPYERFVLDDPPAMPTHAVVRGPFRDGRGAERALAAASRSLWQLGFPWVVASSDLRPARSCAERVYVVSALFATRAEADAFATADRGSRVLPLASAGAPGCWASTWPLFDRPDGTPRIEVTHIERSAPAFSGAVIEAAVADAGALPDPARASCTLEAGRVIVRRDGEETTRFGHRWAPVECDGRPAWAPVEATRRHVVIEPTPEGARLHQLTDVSCDSPHFDVWRLTEDGREPVPELPATFTAGCGG